MDLAYAGQVTGERTSEENAEGGTGSGAGERSFLSDFQVSTVRRSKEKNIPNA